MSTNPHGERIDLTADHYGVCVDCGRDMPTQDDARAHMRETHPDDLMVGSSSHTIRVLNPTPEQRLSRRVAQVVDDAIDESLYDFERLVNSGEFTAEQVTKELAAYPDFADAWAEYMDGAE